ncbi:MAG: indole-3-glycerol-phosphate synthase [Desulfurococcales archaeon]
MEDFLSTIRDVWRSKAILAVDSEVGCIEATAYPASFGDLASSITRWRRERGVAIIAEYKRASPLGIINMWQDLRDYFYQLGDLVAGFSVIVEREWFMGSPKYICMLRGLGYRGPILAKGFIFYEKQIDLYRSCGATSILLISEALEIEKLSALYQYSEKIGLEPVVEINSFEELEKIMRKISVKILGINSRNLRTLEISREQMLDIVKKARREYPDLIIIAESGMKSTKDIVEAIEAGADACLIGTSLMKNPNRSSILKELYTMLNLSHPGT